MQTYNYGIIGNGRICALVSKDASIDWCCFPRFDEGSIFAKILDTEKGGCFAISPTDPEKYTIEQSYVKNTNILITTFSSNSDVFQVIDYIPAYQKIDFLYKPIQIHRLVKVIKGYPRVKIVFDPRFNYGQSKVSIRHYSGYIKAVDLETGEEAYLHTNVPKEYILKQRDFPIKPDSYFVLAYEKQPDSLSIYDVEKDFNLTKKYWQDWVQSCNIPQRYQKEVIRSALVLKLLIYEETGAIIAAPTTSLPEIAGRERNWDYRYCWLRDAYFAINALSRISRIKEAEKFIDYIKSTLIGNLEYIRPIYTIDGGIVPEEVNINLQGHLNSQPVRVGNSATTHYQDDVYGEVILSLFPLFFDERFVREDLEDLWNLVKLIVEIAIRRFREKDQGIWEFRGEAKHYTFSKVMIWAAVDRGYQIAHKLKKKEEAYKWNKIRKGIKEEILKNAWSDDLQSFTQSYEKKHLDASNLLIPILGLIDGKDQRNRQMIKATTEQLKKGGFVFRYVNDDDFGCPETAFLICSFWLVDALVLAGQKDEARKYFEELLKCRNHLGLLSEDIHPESNQLLGNFPQAYSHVAIITSALLLE